MIQVQTERGIDMAHLEDYGKGSLNAKGSGFGEYWSGETKVVVLIRNMRKYKAMKSS